MNKIREDEAIKKEEERSRHKEEMVKRIQDKEVERLKNKEDDTVKIKAVKHSKPLYKQVEEKYKNEIETP